MGRVSLCSEDVDPLVWTPVPGIAVDTLFLLVIQALAIILVSNLFHSLLRRYNQPNAISQILAGMVVGGMGLRNAIVHIDVDNVEDMYNGYIAATRILYMFLVGLETDPRNVGQHHVRRRDLAFMISAIWIVGNFPQKLGFDGLPTSFALGLVFPREGPAARSVADALVPPVNGLLIPFYFATIGMRMNFNTMSGAIILPGVLMMLLGLVGKAIGAAVASAYLNIPLCDALRFSVLLNVKGHVDTMNMQFAKSEGVWAEQALYAMIIGNLASTLVAGPAAAVFVRKEKEAYAMTHQALESLREEAELRMMTCSHSAHSMPALLSLVELMVMEPAKQPAVQVVHLFEGGISVRCGGRGGVPDDAVPAANHRRQIDVVCSSASRDVDAVCRCAAEARAALLLLPCYREQRYDGKMACRLEERRELNVGVLAKAPCTVGLLMDRPYRSSGASFQVPTSVDTSTSTLLHPCSDRAVRHVIAAVFLGGADDREAVSVASRLAENPNIGLTPKELLVGLDEWAEAGRELGAVAEILASNTSMEMGSVLIMQQHRVLVQVPR
uniref:K(+)/H(+) antiporter 13 n=1 Tax=Aegilops tauschii TaxID=37682 RepID=M8BYK3_AEGTA